MENAQEIMTEAKKKDAKERQYPPFSVAMCVYEKDNPIWFDRAVQSTIEQTVKPNEIVLVVDGPVPDALKSAIDAWVYKCADINVEWKVVELPVNQGLGNALKVAIEHCTHEWIARMDSDDVAVRDRFEQQLSYLVDHEEIDVVGGNITEFIGEESNIVGERAVPQTEEELAVYIKSRCPLNHVTVLYKKSAVLKAGGYLDWYCNEDYYLWLRMHLCGCRFANTGTVLVNVRVGKEMYSRRGGKRYYQSEKQLQRYMLENKIISRGQYRKNVFKRWVVQRLLPNKIRGWVFRKFARKKVNKNT